MKLPKILVIIVTWNKEKYILKLLDSLKDIDYDRDCMDILLVDNASSDSTVESVSRLYPWVKILCNEENLGGTGGFNTGLDWAFSKPGGSYDYLWLLDNDVVVNRHALAELVNLLGKNRDAAIAGSTMMQLDYPWRINEIGAYYSRDKGSLVFNFHGVPVDIFRGRSMDDLCSLELNMADFITDFKDYIDVDYVAAASLLVRADVAEKAGLWRDFFIHFDDVEWCLRIAGMGYRVLASCRSVIWHVSAAAKVPTWVLYYDSRNALDVVKRHGRGRKVLARAVNHELKRSFYYALIGRMELARLFIEAVDDFHTGFMGKKKIDLPSLSSHIEEPLASLPFMASDVKKILVPWTVNMYATGLQEILVKVMMQRPDVSVDFLTHPDGVEIFQFPRINFVDFHRSRFRRYITYWSLRNRYDLVLQSEYERVPGLSWLGGKIMFVSNTTYFLSSGPGFRALFIFFVKEIGKRWRFKGLMGRIKGFLYGGN
ncbi:MAG: glycosyltransferase family 2 protein [Desulfamplus sp.]|nr:glycosyltransferase family 2 protein [Desulfamplus sp.]